MDTSSKKEAVVRLYELTFLVPGTMTDQEAEKIKAEVDALLKKHKADDVKVEDWGKRPLSYLMTHESKKQSDAYYTHIMFKLDAGKAQDFEHDIFFPPKIMRHLLLVSDEKENVVAEAKETR